MQNLMLQRRELGHGKASDKDRQRQRNIRKPCRRHTKSHVGCKHHTKGRPFHKWIFGLQKLHPKFLFLLEYHLR